MIMDYFRRKIPQLFIIHLVLLQNATGPFSREVLEFIIFMKYNKNETILQSRGGIFVCKNQEKYRQWSSILCVLALMGSLLLAGCTAPSGAQEQTQPSETTNATEDPGPSQDTQPDETEPDASDDPSLTIFRQVMVETPQVFAAAYFGYALPDGDVPADPRAVMEGVSPELCENLPFLLQIPRENILGTEGHLFCLLPRDVDATVAVNYSAWDAATETYADAQVLYRSEKGDPILLMTNNTPWCMETEVIITDSQGDVTIWYPFVDEANRIASLCDENGTSLYYDFSPYDRLNYENLMGGVPEEMVGSWDLVGIEVEGDRMESEPGCWTVEITMDDDGAFRISYTDKNFPEDSFSDRELILTYGELYPDCGNNQWIAEVQAADGEMIRYAVTLLEDGTLLMQYGWETDGMPMVSHGWYRRAA